MSRSYNKTIPRPRKAMILAAGYGTRMRPLSDDLPKAIMPLWNRSLLARNVDLLRGWGVHDILVNAHHRADQVIREAIALSDATCRITCSHEPEILGTGGALRRAEWFFDEQPFWLINADVVALLNPAPLLRRFRQSRPLAALWMHDTLGPRTVEVAGGRVRNFQSKTPRTQWTQTFCGLHLVSPRILDYLPESGFASIITAYERAMGKGQRVEAVTVPEAYWADVGTPERYLQAHWDTAHSSFILEGRASARPGHAEACPSNVRSYPGHSTNTCLSPTARVHPSATLRNCVTWDDAEITAGARVEDAVIGRGARIERRVSGVAVRYPLGLSDREIHALRRQLGGARFCVPGPDHKSGKQELAPPFTVNLLPARGSARSFIRIFAEPPDDGSCRAKSRHLGQVEKDGDPSTSLPPSPKRLRRTGRSARDDRAQTAVAATNSIMLMRYDPARTENSYYVRQARFLRRQEWPVPEVLYASKTEPWAILEDVGDDSLLDRMTQSYPSSLRYAVTKAAQRRRTPKHFVQDGEFDTSQLLVLYRTILDRVLDLHGRVTRAFRRSRVPSMPPFGPALYRYERDLFEDHYLRGCLHLDESVITRINRELQRVARTMTRTQPVLLHRDLQSSNIFFRGDEPVFIDFQGMRLGPAAYDLASLLCDPYVALSREAREELLDYYAQRAGADTFTVESYRYACVQRLCQAIGAYARLSVLPGCERFREHIPTALRLLNEALGELPDLRSLKAIVVSSVVLQKPSALLEGRASARPGHAEA